MINARAYSFTTAMADVPRDRLMAALMIMRSDVDKPVYMCRIIIFSAYFDIDIVRQYREIDTKYQYYIDVNIMISALHCKMMTSMSYTYIAISMPHVYIMNSMPHTYTIFILTIP